MDKKRKKYFVIICSFLVFCILCGCSKEQKTFPIEELEDYAQPIVFLSLRETGETFTRAWPQLSHDNKYVLFARSYVDKPDKLLCLKVEDESLCEIYAFDEDECVEYVFWWSE